jgi:uncharacterized protein YjbJ (UPF0337 family)
MAGTLSGLGTCHCVPALIELENAMSINSLKGSAEQEFGRLEEAVGELAGDRTMQAKGMLDEACGAVEAVYGRANQTARGALGQAASRARNARGELEDFVGDRPMLATGIALGIGIALGAMVLAGGRATYRRPTRRDEADAALADRLPKRRKPQAAGSGTAGARQRRAAPT